MKALSIHPYWADKIRSGEKTIEVRRWSTRHRGLLLICASKRPRCGDLPAGVAVAVARLIDVRPMVAGDVEQAGGVAAATGNMAWVLADIRPVESFPVKGRQGLFDVAYSGRYEQQSLFPCRRR